VIPWSPFGPTDFTSLDEPGVTAAAEALRQSLVKTREAVEKIRRGGAPPEPPDDRHPPVTTPPKRADELKPFLLIRTFRGDAGARPLDLARFPEMASHQSPDILMTTPATNDPVVVGRDAFNTMLRGRIVWDTPPGHTFDVWVHVWNLGRAPAFGVRVRAWAVDWPTGTRRYLGGRRIDLGDRTSETSHLVVKIGPWVMGATEHLLAVAESIADVSNDTRDWSQDRHVGVRDMFEYTVVPPVIV
jgi:hypothetical protein